MTLGIRIKSGKYTDSDVLALCIKYRESSIGPFIREVGDFIAHAKRDRGATLDAIAYAFAQLAFFQTYQGTNKKPLEPKGKCGWWLRHYFLTKTKYSTESEIHAACGLTKKQAKNAIKSWFPDKLIYPTTIKCNDPDLLLQLANKFAQLLVGNSIFDLSNSKLEIMNMFDKEGIEHGEVDRFLVGIATLLNEKSIEIVPGFTAKIKLHVGKQRHIKIDHPENTTDFWYGINLPDGELSIMVHTENMTGDGLVSVALCFLDTNIDTEPYFSRDFIVTSEHGNARLQLGGMISFDASKSYPVNLVQ